MNSNSHGNFVMVMQKESRLLTIDSANRQQGSNVSFLTKPYNVQARAIALRSLSFTYNVHVINDYCNRIVIDGSTIMLTNGNYSITQLVAHLNSLQTSFAFSYNTITNKITVTCTSTHNLSFVGDNTLLGSMLGFCESNGDSQDISISYTFPFQVNLTPFRYFDVVSSSICHSGGTSLGGSNGNIIARVHIGVIPPNNIFEYVDQTQHVINLDSEKGIGEIDLKLVTDIGKLLPLDNTCEITLNFNLFM